METAPEPFVDDFLAHYGVKGMKWGVRKSETNARTKAYVSASETPSKLTRGELMSKVQSSEQMFVEKAGFRLTKKQALIGASVGAGLLIAAGGAYYAANNSDINFGDLASRLKTGYPAPGSKVTQSQFAELRKKAQMRTMLGDGYITQQSYLQGEYTLPAGHVFSRVSSANETDFKKNTYALHTKADFDRYVSEFSKDGHFTELYRVSFSAKTPIRVPSLTQRLDVLKDTMSTGGRKVSDSEVIKEYESMLKTFWTEPKAQTYFNALSAKGFNAIVDDADAGIAGESPLLLFDPSVLGSKSSKKLSKEEVSTSKNSLTEIRNRK